MQQQHQTTHRRVCHLRGVEENIVSRSAFNVTFDFIFFVVFVFVAVVVFVVVRTQSR